MSKRFLLLSLGVPGVGLLFLATQAEEGLPPLTSLGLPALIILALVLLNGFFVAAEFAIIAVRATKMEQMANEGSNTAAAVFNILESRRLQDRYIATAQVGITVASLGLAMYGEPAISHFVEPYLGQWFGWSEETLVTLGYIIALSLMTYLHVVVGEMVPKALALTSSTNMALFLARPMRVVQAILHYPVLWLNGIGNLLLKLFRVPPAHGHAALMAPEELELIVVESAEGGLINVEEEEMIRNIFDFSERVVGQVMTPRIKVQAIPLDISYEDLLTLVTESRHSRFPVFDNDLDHIVGILHLKDLVRQTMKMQGSFDLRLILRAAPSVPEDQRVEVLLAVLKKEKLHMAVVLDEFGGMAGIVTLEDLVEEVVGEVRDEFDLEREPYVELEPGVLEIAGDYLVDELAEKVYLGEVEQLPDVETVGGLIVTQLGRPPQVNDKIIYNEGVVFTVLDVDRRAVSRARVEYLATDSHVPEETPETAASPDEETAVPPTDKE